MCLCDGYKGSILSSHCGWDRYAHIIDSHRTVSSRKLAASFELSMKSLNLMTNKDAFRCSDRIFSRGGGCLARRSCVCPGGGVCQTPPLVNRITDTCENITLLQLRCGW